MYTLNDFTEPPNQTNGEVITPSFLKLLSSKWDELHKNSDIFRYRINKLEEKLVDGKYLLQLNPDRRIKRRTPEQIDDICQPFDINKFNFTKVSPKEILFSIEGPDSDMHTILVNVSPISKYHSLLCPSVNKCLPQIVTTESLELAVNIMFRSGECRDLRIGFNSLCALASVNHLHYHLVMEKNTLPVEKVKWVPIKRNIYHLDEDYPTPAFCFEIPRHSIAQICKEVYKLIELFLEKSIAHNILLSKKRLDGSNKDVYAIVWPRKSTSGAKQLSAFNVAVLELSGWFPVYDAEDFKNLQSRDLEKELKRWKFDDFDLLCEQVKNLY